MESQSDVCPELVRAMSACADPIFVVDETWTVTHWNKSAEAAFGQTAAEVQGRRCYEVMAGIDDGGREVCRVHCEKWALARRGARIQNFDIRALPTHDKWANVSILPLSDASGRTFALAHLLRNVGRAKRLEHFIQEISTAAEDVLAPHTSNGAIHGPSPVHLTNRELEVLMLLAHGAGTMTIAEKLGVSRHTVHNHIAVVLNKLGVHSRAEAVAYAFEHHLA
ncbi:MAG TPA: LuxR C-terminal-related transcriptional regulator [Candidatus Limnocylindria bacterium]|nr:LuxR C-terminal-related transcriptional regulator [Candidatus Limnocylindria bacterium]